MQSPVFRRGIHRSQIGRERNKDRKNMNKRKKKKKKKGKRKCMKTLDENFKSILSKGIKVVSAECTIINFRRNNWNFSRI